MGQAMPFDFLLDYLPANVVVKPAIGMFYVYWEGKIMLIFRQVKKNPQHNGIWISSHKQFHRSLKEEIPAISDFVFDDDGEYQSAWLHLKDDHDDFEDAAIRLCELVTARDPRVGRPTAKAIAITGVSSRK